MDISKRISELRKKHNLSQAELAKKLGLTRAAVNYWESGSRTPTLDNIRAMCDIFNVDISYLTGESDVTMRYLSPIEMDIIDRFRALDDSQQDLVLNMLGIKRESSSDSRLQKNA